MEEEQTKIRQRYDYDMTQERGGRREGEREIEEIEGARDVTYNIRNSSYFELPDFCISIFRYLYLINV